MKRVVIIATVLITLSSFTDNRVGTNNQMENKKAMEKQDKQNIELLLNEYKRSLNTSDAKLATSLYTKDGMFMPTEAPTATGAENIIGAYEYVFSQIQLNIEFYIEEIVVDGELAFATTTSKGSTLIHANGQTVPEENRELFVFEKENGQWKIARYMFNKMTPQK